MTTPDFLSLVDSCVCTNIRKLSRIITRIYNSYLEPANLNINQLGLLLTIQGLNEKNEDTSVGEIGNRLVMEKSTLSRNLRKLEDEGLIKMEIHPESRSQKIAVVTEEGLETLFDAYGYWLEIQERIRSQFGSENFSQLLHYLNLLQSSVSKEFNEL